MADKKIENEPFTLPEGRVINENIFEKDTYVDVKGKEGTPSYKVELAYDDDASNTIDLALAALCVKKWGAGADDDYFNGTIRSPMLNGDEMADAREKRNKPGDAYRGKQVIRSHTIFNRDGRDGPGGIQIFNEDREEVEATDQSTIYNGCFGIIGVTANFYIDSVSKQKCISLYLGAFQKTADGDPLRTARDHSSLFQARGTPAEAGKGRRRRA